MRTASIALVSPLVYSADSVLTHGCASARRMRAMPVADSGRCVTGTSLLTTTFGCEMK